jgi:phage terminase large subunit-like protein
LRFRAIDRGGQFSTEVFAVTPADTAIRFIETLRLPEGPLAGQKVKLGRFQRQFIEGAFGEGVSLAALSVGRGNAKTMLGAGLALGHLVGKIEPQPRREIIGAAKTRDQGMVAWGYVRGLAESLPVATRRKLTFLRSPRLEVRFEDKEGEHSLRMLASDARNALGLAPTFSLLDERAFWDPDKGDQLENAITSAMGKRCGRTLVISTSAPTDSHSFSRLLDDPGEGAYVQEHRAPDGCEPDDVESLTTANPGIEAGFVSLEWLRAQARRAMQRGGNTLASFRLFHLNQRTSDETRAVLIEAARWQACETADVPARDGPLVCGIDLGGSASMSAWANFWPQTGRLECYGAFAGKPGLLDRGRSDGVADRYTQMQQRDELVVLGENVVNVADFIGAMVDRLDGYAIATIACDRFRQSEFIEALNKTSVRVVPTWRGMGWKDGSEDVERFRAFVFDQRVKAKPSLLLRSAFADAIVVIDHAGNSKITKSKSLSRIDAACAAVLAIAEGSRILGRKVKPVRAAIWA